MNIKKKIKYMLSTAGSFGLLATVATVAAGETTSDSSTNTTTSTKQEITYNIFPEVQNIKYTDGSISITPEVNLVFENGIDAATIARFDQVLKLRNLTYTKSRNIVSGKTNILVGIKDDTDTLVDNELKTLGITPDATLDNKLDSYMLNAGTFNNGSYITLLAKDATAAFYGATTLWHIFNQLDGFKIRNLTIKDYADLKVRGVSDAYFWDTYTDLGNYTTNNRWNSADDIIGFMKYASFYKLNTFIFRPDDLILPNIDSKNSASKWQELYTEEEINKFKEVLATSKESKVQFDFSFDLLKSFDVSNDTDYKTQFDLLTKKMTQMLQIGVRQFSVVSRGVAVTHENYITKLFVDLIQWLKQQKQTYTDLNTNMLFFGRYGEYS
ncbi:hyaluronoglucosaminidase, partial [Mycoplasmopsis mustelae]